MILFLYYLSIYSLGFFGLDKLLSKFNFLYPKLDYNRRVYVIKNIVKSVILFYICVRDHLYLYKLFNNITDSNIWILFDSKIKQSLISYCVIDMMGLFCIRNLPIRTKIHHTIVISVTLACIYEVLLSIEIIRLLFIHGVLSCVSFPVNLLLGLRLISRDNYYSFKKFCAILYTLNIIISLYYQYTYAISVTYNYYIHVILLAPVIIDDIILMKWLIVKKE